MAKKNKSKYKAKEAPPKPQEPAASLVDKVATSKEGVLALSNGIDLAEQASEPPPEAEDPHKALADLKELLDICQRLKEKLENDIKQKENRLEELRKAQNEADEKLKGERSRINDDRGLLRKEQEDFKKEKAEWNEKMVDLLQREKDATDGFTRLKNNLLSGLEKEREELQEQLNGLRKEITQELQKWLLDSNQSLEGFREKVKEIWSVEEARACKELEEAKACVGEQEKSLKEEKKRFQRKRTTLRKRMEKLKWDHEDLKTSRENLEERVRTLADGEVNRKQIEIDKLQEQLRSEKEDRKTLFAKVAELEKQLGRVKGRSLEEIVKENTELKKERDGLKDELQKRPGAQTEEIVHDLEKKLANRESQNSFLMQEIGQLKYRLATHQKSVVEIETMTLRTKALEAQKEMLAQAVEDMQSQYDSLLRTSEQKIAFPALTGYDKDPKLQSGARVPVEERDLKTLVHEVQHLIASPIDGRRLYFSLADLRCFLAGLHMSRLHLLQGISGTGKTSLPIAFARALNSEFRLIEVQAGWRDRQDLIGHYNAFEKRYHETEFLHALYLAQCPANRSRPFIIVLDEMNLSHPEQYFADILSALEQSEENRQIDLMTAPEPNAPALMIGGRTIRIPSNVWFVGTANHDETTKDFADKTYDRAHVMELPRHREEFEVKKLPAQTIGIEYLFKQFDQAQKKHQSMAEEAYNFIEIHFKEILQNHFRIGWGNRLRDQMMRFAPVVIQAGGSIGEATDHILFSKIFRKFRDRHDNQPESMKELLKILNDNWYSFDNNALPTKSRQLLHEELRRLGDWEAEADR